jgi:hypothetical protein
MPSQIQKLNDLIRAILPANRFYAEKLGALGNFTSLADFTARAGGGGLASEGEDIRGLELPFAALMDDLAAGRVRDMPLIATAQWLAMNRDKLRPPA